MTELKTVFEALDVTSRGYITVEEFKKSFENFDLSDSLNSGGIKSLKEKEKRMSLIIQQIAPAGDDKIYFDDFVQGVQQIMNEEGNCNNLTEAMDYKQEHLNKYIEDTEKYSASSGCDRKRSASNITGIGPNNDIDSAYSVHSLEESEGISQSPGDPDTGLGGMTTDLDEGDVSFRSDQGISAAARLLRRNGVSARPITSKPSSNNANPIQREGIRATWPKRRQRLYDDCDNACNLQTSPDNNSSHLLHRRTDSASSFASSLAGSRSDILLEQWDVNVSSIQQQLERMEKKLESMNDNQADGQIHHSRLREENRLLMERVHQLEEQLRDMDIKSHQLVQSEKDKMRQKLAAVDRDHQDDMDRMRTKVYTLEKQVSELLVDAAAVKGNLEKFKWEKDLLHDKCSEAESKMNSLQDELERVRGSSKAEIDRLKKERNICEQNLDKLSQELICLREKSGNLASPTALSFGASDLHQRYREVQELVRNLTHENRRLQEQLSDMQDELLCQTVQEGRSLLRPCETSLAAELDSYTKDEVMELLVKEKDTNYKLRDYIEKIITRVMEKEPSLLEIS